MPKKTEEVEDTKSLGGVEGEETVTVSRKKLEEFMARLERVESAASKSALAHYDNQHREEAYKEVRIRTFDGKIVKGERTTKNVVERNQAGQWREEQEVELTLDSGDKVTLPYVYYIRNYKHLAARVVREMKVIDPIEKELFGDFVYEVTLPTGETLKEVGSKVVN